MKKQSWTTADITRRRKCHRSTALRAACRLGIYGTRVGVNRVFTYDEYQRICRAIRKTRKGA